MRVGPSRYAAAAIPARPVPSPVVPASTGAWPASPDGVPAAEIAGSISAGGPGAVPAGVVFAGRPMPGPVAATSGSLRSRAYYGRNRGPVRPKRDSKPQ
jgi:hypothetical protein